MATRKLNYTKINTLIKGFMVVLPVAIHLEAKIESIDMDQLANDVNKIVNIQQPGFRMYNSQGNPFIALRVSNYSYALNEAQHIFN